MSSSEKHDILGLQIALAIREYARVVPYYSGTVRAFHNPERVFAAGKPGVSDWIGLLCTGRFLAIEVKTGTGKLSKEQIAFRAMVESFGGLFIEGRNVDEVVERVKSAVSN